MKRYKVYEKYGAGAKKREDERDAVAEKIGVAGEAALHEMLKERAVGMVMEEDFYAANSNIRLEHTKVFRLVGGHVLREALWGHRVVYMYIEDTGLREREVDGKRVLVSVRNTQEWAGYWDQRDIEARGQEVLNPGSGE